jgi:hypothetical protein
VEEYEVLASDGESVGTVVGVRDGNVVVERGTLRKSRRAVPLAFVRVDEDARVVRATISKQMIEESPKLGGGVDEAAVARYYGLVEGGASPANEGYGEVGPGDPAVSAERQELASGLEPATSERARMREHPEQLEGEPVDLRKNPPPHHLGRRQAF